MIWSPAPTMSIVRIFATRHRPQPSHDPRCKTWQLILFASRAVETVSEAHRLLVLLGLRPLFEDHDRACIKLLFRVDLAVLDRKSDLLSNLAQGLSPAATFILDQS